MDNKEEFTGKRMGRVFLVGAGPGDPRLLTLRGLQCLQKADCVLFDGLVNPSVLDFAPQAEKNCVGKHGKTPIWQQSAINDELIRLARLGKTVVRLKGGDPAVFARTAEELEALESNGIAYEVVPGITAALAVAGYAGIPLTHRDHSSAVALVTGQQSEDAPHGIDWEALAKFPGSLSIYMGVTTSKNWTSELIAFGKPPETPAAIVRRCSWSDQQTIYCRLDEVAGHLTSASKMRPPVLVIVGEVAHLGKPWNWFERQPLFGCGVWIPRAAHQTEELRDRLLDLGANVIAQPIVQMGVPSDTTSLEVGLEFIKNRQVQGIAFASTNGVDGLMQALFAQGGDSRSMASVRLAAVGPATARQLAVYGLRADVVPESDFSASGLVAQLGESVRGEHWLVSSSNQSGDSLPSGLRQFGAQVTECLTYVTTPCSDPGGYFASALEAGQVHFAMITSCHIARLSAELLGQHKQSVQPIAISSRVAGTLEQLEWPAAAIAQNNSVDELVEAILRVQHQTRDA